MAAIAAAFAAGARADSSTPRLLANARRKAAQYSAAAGGAEAAAAGSGTAGSGLDACDRVEAATDPMIGAADQGRDDQEAGGPDEPDGGHVRVTLDAVGRATIHGRVGGQTIGPGRQEGVWTPIGLFTFP